MFGVGSDSFFLGGLIQAATGNLGGRGATPLKRVDTISRVKLF